MIPKIIHYCWFGGKALPQSAKAYIAGWQALCPDFEFMCWDDSRISPGENPFVKQAFEAEKWAFAADYARLKALYQYGGIYLDTDLEMLRSPEKYMGSEVFLGFESSSVVSTAVIGCIPQHPFIERLLREYDSRRLIAADGSIDLTPNVVYVTKALEEMGLKKTNEMQRLNGITVYPSEYFSPKDLSTGKVNLTENTCTIHHFNASWLPLRNRINRKTAQLLGPERAAQVRKWLRKNDNG